HQVRRLAYASPFTDMSNEPAITLASRLAALAPGDLNRVHFTTCGSTAIDSAFRMVQYYQSCRGHPDKVHMIARRQAYHGSTFAAMSLGNKASDRSQNFRYIHDTIHHLSAPDLYRMPAEMDEEAYCGILVEEFRATLVQIGPDKAGGFFAEPIMGAGGVLIPPRGYLARMREVCREHDILFVADEVVTAFGRLGHWFASKDVFDIEPDIICTAKGLSSGYRPIAAVIYSDRLHDAFVSASGDRFYPSGFTYSGHPVACAAALKNIEIIERDDILDHARDAGTYFGRRLQDLAVLPLVGDVRGMGLMRCIENVHNKSTRALLPDTVNIGKRISDVAESLGVIVRPVGHLNIMSPPLTITREEIDTVVDQLGEAIQQVAHALQEEGWDLI
ncbi:MAG: aminotransferase class III-fold pyridoxal phosphate-dependent enzyme, partial [Rhodobacteraceae bacterium]|nr:aminotransferase class III-fold pyridoxal phosphate-dependent enzyme [Paracoccaceae bacterium]